LERNIIISTQEVLGLGTFSSQIGQDKWVSEAIFPGVKNGFFLDVGSGDGTRHSNTKVLEQKGWTGICIDPFPTNMQGRTCQVFKEVVFSVAGKRIKFQAARHLGGITDTLGVHKDKALEASTVEFTTVTLADILQRAKAPRLIHFVSLDIEGAELDALKGFPFNNHQIGAMAVEHNYEEPKRTQIQDLMNSHGYKRVHSWKWDDFYVFANP
jgi:FkbM family methyltransferase